MLAIHYGSIVSYIFRESNVSILFVSATGYSRENALISHMASVRTRTVEDAVTGPVKVDGHELQAIELCLPGLAEVTLLNLGVTLTSWKIPDIEGKLGDDIIIGLPTEQDYVANNGSYFGSIVGRYAGRISNASFMLPGQLPFYLTATEGNNTLHGGPMGFSRVIWDIIEMNVDESHPDSVSVTLQYISGDGEGGWPGTLQTQCEVTLCRRTSPDNAPSIVLEMKYTLATDQLTPVSLTHHPYFQLLPRNVNVGDEPGVDPLKATDKSSSSPSSSINGYSLESHRVALRASEVLELNESKCPSGKRIPCQDTEYADMAVGERHLGQNKLSMDTYFVGTPLGGARQMVRLSASDVVEDRGERHRTLLVESDYPCVVVYTADHFDKIEGKNGDIYNAQAGIAVEPQEFPNAPNVPEFPQDAWLEAGSMRERVIRYVCETNYAKAT